ncbi:hypothetical protein [Paraliomyxa miuraensis]|uniref:hypothetical protein n=1 Tax=Paraliomyxa miuraensis TaxID=376150 RepID=UPI0022512A97|nr:hypothetical protein [Paraliomyxa miuraensis]MCX4241576.1 hypothetical protein [Paraliomyxa miuraensis]
MQPPIALSAGFEHGLSIDLVRAALAALRAIVAPSGPWPKGARRLADAVVWKTGYDLEPEAIAPAAPAETAAAVPGLPLRTQLVRLAIVGAMIDGRPSPAIAGRVDALAGALGVDSLELEDLRLLAHGRLMRLRRHLMPRAWVFSILRKHVREHGWWSLVKMLAVMMRLRVDRGIQARFRALDELPAHTLGPTLLAFWRNAGFSLPGSRGAPFYIVYYHDVSHVLAGYGTDPASEVQAGCFQGGYQHSDGFMLVFFTLCQFHLGIRLTPIAQAEEGQWDPFRALDAICRGAGMNRDLTDGTWDLWEHAAEDVDELRRRYHIASPAWPPGSVQPRAA